MKASLIYLDNPADCTVTWGTHTYTYEALAHMYGTPWNHA